MSVSASLWGSCWHHPRGWLWTQSLFVHEESLCSLSDTLQASFARPQGTPMLAAEAWHSPGTWLRVLACLWKPCLGESRAGCLVGWLSKSLDRSSKELRSLKQLLEIGKASFSQPDSSLLMLLDVRRTSVQIQTGWVLLEASALLSWDKILSRGSVKDLFTLFLCISSLNRVALDGNSLPIFSAAICDVCFISPIWTWTFSFSSRKHLRKEITNSFSHFSFLDLNFWTSSKIAACSWLMLSGASGALVWFWKN